MKIFLKNYIRIITDFSKIYKEHRIYTSNCILVLKKKTWFKQNISRERYDNISHEGYDILIEDNEYDYNEIYNHIPYEHLHVIETYEIFNIDYNLSLIKHTYLDQTSYYFETTDTSIQNTTLDKLVSFLSK